MSYKTKLITVALPLMSFLAWLGCSRLSADSAALGPGKCEVCHVQQPGGNLHEVHRTKGYACTVCHAAGDHDNGAIDVEIAASFDSSGTARFDPSTGTCSAVYCHGSFRTGDSSLVTVTDTIGNRCGACHDMALLSNDGHHGLLPPAILPKCGFCHPGNSLADSTTNDTLHVNGKIDTGGCGYCHDPRPWIR